MKTTIIDQIEITRNGTVQIRLLKLSSDGDLIGNHRMVIEPVDNADICFSQVNAHLQGMNMGQVQAEDIARVKSFIPIAHTAEVVEAFVDAKSRAAQTLIVKP